MKKMTHAFGGVGLLSLLGCGAAPAPDQATTAVVSAETLVSRQDQPAEHGEGRDRRAGNLDHIFVIMMENHGTAEIVGNTADAPYINHLVNHHGLADNYFGVTHPSLPNYLAAISGDFQGIWDDCKAGPSITCAPEEFVPDSGDATSVAMLTPEQIAGATATPHWFEGRNLVDQLESKHLTWKAYMQALPSVGSDVEYAPVDTVGGVEVPRKLYAQKHNPFMYFSDIRDNPRRVARIVPFSEFDADIGCDQVADFVWISPDQCRDMHGVSAANAQALGIPDCAAPDSGLDHKVIALGDAFVKETVQKIQRSRAWQGNSAIVVVWDEDDYAGVAGCCGSPKGVGGVTLGGAGAPAIVITSKDPERKVVSTPFNHYSLLGTIQHLWHLGCLGNTCSLPESGLMTKLFRP